MSKRMVNASGKQQRIAVQRMIKNPKKIIFITGRAGTGKTTLAQSCGLDHVFEQKDRFHTLSYTRQQIQMGEHLGYLSGDIDEKTEPFMAPFYTHLRNRLGEKKGFVKATNKILFRPIQMMRGDTYPREFMIVDEAQNLDVHSMKGVGSRLDLGSTFVFTLNFAQIDDPKLRDPEKNGAYQLLKGLYDGRHFAKFDHIHLDEIKREEEAGLIEDILTPEGSLDPRFEELEKRGLDQTPFQTIEKVLA